MMNKVLNINEILEFLPHRYPFLLVDKVLDYSNEYVKAVKNVTANEQFFMGHFPGAPVMPGVLMIEAMAQASAFLTYDIFREEAKRMDVLFTGIESVKFRRMVIPGDQLIIEMGLVKSRKEFWWTKGKVTVDGELACEAGMSAIIKYR